MGQPIGYASMALSPAQLNYPQIEKEATAIKFGCKKFHQYIYGKKLKVETDHKPLETIFKKPLNAFRELLKRMVVLSTRPMNSKSSRNLGISTVNLLVHIILDQMD